MIGSCSQPDALAEKNRPPVRLASGQVIDDWVTLEEKRVVAVADAMPADKYQFAPTNAIALTENCRPVLSVIGIFRQLTLPQQTGRRGSPQLGRRTHWRNSRNRKALAVVTSATILVTPSNR